jgi:hypothetical protein
MGDNWRDVDGFLREASGSPQRSRAGSPPPAEAHKWKFMMFWFEVMLYTSMKSSYDSTPVRNQKCRWIAIFTDSLSNRFSPVMNNWALQENTATLLQSIMALPQFNITHSIRHRNQSIMALPITRSGKYSCVFFPDCYPPISLNNWIDMYTSVSINFVLFVFCVNMHKLILWPILKAMPFTNRDWPQ